MPFNPNRPPSFRPSEANVPPSEFRRTRGLVEVAVERARRFGPTIALFSLLSGADASSYSRPVPAQHPVEGIPEIAQIQQTPEALIADCRQHEHRPGDSVEVAHETISEEGDVWVNWGGTEDPRITGEMSQVNEQIEDVVRHHLEVYRSNHLEPHEVIDTIRVVITAERDPFDPTRADEARALASAHQAAAAIRRILVAQGLEDKIDLISSFSDMGSGGLEAFGVQLYPFGFPHTAPGVEQRRQVTDVIHAIQDGKLKALDRLLPQLNGRYEQLQRVYDEQVSAQRRIHIDLQVDLFPIQVITDEGAPVPPAITTIALQTPPPDHAHPIHTEPLAMGSLLSVAARRGGRRESDPGLESEPFDEITQAWLDEGDSWSAPVPKIRREETEDDWFSRGEAT